MMHTKFFWLMPLLISGLILSGCSPKQQYNNRMKQELAGGERYDTLFLGLYFGMNQKDFYMHCWKLNQKGLIRQGSNNSTVEYQTRQELKHPGTINFYPAFLEDKICELPMEFAYNGWAPWNKKMSSEVLQKDVLRWCRKNYGGGFIKVRHPERGLAFIKIDGNRRITIFRKDDLHVWAIFTDIQAVQQGSDTTSREGVRLDSITKDIE
jgi:hypothetical protein